MAKKTTKSTKAAKKVNTTKNIAELPKAEDDNVYCLLEFADTLKTMPLRPELIERFGPQLDKVEKRLRSIASSMTKALELESTKAEREAKKDEKIAAKKAKLTEQLNKIKVQLDQLNASDLLK